MDLSQSLLIQPSFLVVASQLKSKSIKLPTPSKRLARSPRVILLQRNTRKRLLVLLNRQALLLISTKRLKILKGLRVAQEIVLTISSTSILQFALQLKPPATFLSLSFQTSLRSSSTRFMTNLIWLSQFSRKSLKFLAPLLMNVRTMTALTHAQMRLVPALSASQELLMRRRESTSAMLVSCDMLTT